MKKTNSIEVLIVEDDVIISRLHKFGLENLSNVESREFYNGKEALDYLDRKKVTKKVLVLLDLNMPVMNGWKFLKECRTKPYADCVYVVIVTSSPFTEDYEEAENYDMVLGYYTKPLKREQILEIFSLKEFAEYMDSNSKRK